jgi:hypothetical protein
MSVEKPNVKLPLAMTYNQRNNAGFTKAQAGVDQRKVNCLYEIGENDISGNKTLHLVKRPGPTDNSTDFTGSGSVGYLVAQGPFNLAPSATPWLFHKSTGNVIAVNDASGTGVDLLTDANYAPAYVDSTYISGTSTVLVQLRKDYATAQKCYYASDIDTWTQITDSDFTGLVHRGKIEHLDGYAFVLSSTNNIYNSDLNSLSAWQSQNFIKKQIQQDTPTGLAKFKQHILAFGMESVEVFYNAGNQTGSPLSRIPNLQAKIGLGAPSGMYGSAPSRHTHYYCVIGNILYFVGKRSPTFFGTDTQGLSGNGLFAYNGQTFEKVSNDYADKLLTYNGDIVGPYSVNAFPVNGHMAVAIQWTAPSATTQKWLMYFPEWKEWFEWESTAFGPVNCGDWFMKPGIARATAFRTPDTWTDNGGNFTMTVQFRLPGEDGSRKRMPMYGVVGDTDTSANNLEVSFSDDDDANFSTARNIDMTSQRKLLFRGGAFYKRTMRLVSTNARPLRLKEFVARVE